MKNTQLLVIFGIIGFILSMLLFELTIKEEHVSDKVKEHIKKIENYTLKIDSLNKVMTVEVIAQDRIIDNLIENNIYLREVLKKHKIYVPEGEGLRLFKEKRGY